MNRPFLLGWLATALLLASCASPIELTIRVPVPTPAEPSGIAAPPIPVGDGPTLQDHWHVAYGLQVCDDFLPPFASQVDVDGIHSHAEGLVHVHPFIAEATGHGATVARFLANMGVELTEESLELDNGAVAAASCDGEPVSWRLFHWDPHPATQLPTGEPYPDPRPVEDVRFARDGGAMVIAAIPDGDLPRLPPSVVALEAHFGVESG